MMMTKTLPPIAEPVMIARRVEADMGDDEGADKVVGIKLVNYTPTNPINRVSHETKD